MDVRGGVTGGQTTPLVACVAASRPVRFVDDPDDGPEVVCAQGPLGPRRPKVETPLARLHDDAHNKTGTPPRLAGLTLLGRVARVGVAPPERLFVVLDGPPFVDGLAV